MSGRLKTKWVEPGRGALAGELLARIIHQEVATSVRARDRSATAPPGGSQVAGTRVSDGQRESRESDEDATGRPPARAGDSTRFGGRTILRWRRS